MLGGKEVTVRTIALHGTFIDNCSTLFQEDKPIILGDNSMPYNISSIINLDIRYNLKFMFKKIPKCTIKLYRPA